MSVRILDEMQNKEFRTLRYLRKTYKFYIW